MASIWAERSALLRTLATGPEPALLDWYGYCGMNKLCRRVWGHAPQGIFLKLGTLRSLLRPCLSQNATRITTLLEMKW